MEKLKLILSFLKWFFYCVIAYFLTQMIVGCIMWIAGVIALALILDLFKKPEKKEKEVPTIEKFMAFMQKNKASKQE